MDIEIDVNGQKYVYSHAIDSRIRHDIAWFQNRSVPLRIVVNLTATGVCLVLAFPHAVLDDDKTVTARRLRSDEDEIADIWRRCGLDGVQFTADRLIEFLHKVKP